MESNMYWKQMKKLFQSSGFKTVKERYLATFGKWNRRIESKTKDWLKQKKK